LSPVPISPHRRRVSRIYLPRTLVSQGWMLIFLCHTEI
jgi:hypothetical protein